MNPCRRLSLLLLPLTVGGCQPKRATTQPTAPPSIRFEEVTAPAGIRFQHHPGADGRFRIPETNGPGCALFDYDGDGLLDIFLVDSMSWPDRPQVGGKPALYHNEGGGAFRDATQEAGLAVRVYGQGCAVADFDNDGHPDLLLTCVGQNRLFRNQGNGAFKDVTAHSGLEANARWAWSTSAAWVDYNRDGKLDLFVGRYVRWSPEGEVPCYAASGKRTYCGPNQYLPDHCVLYQNLGGGKFRDVSRETGIAAPPAKALGVIPLDADGDGWPDLFVANDQIPNLLFHNEQGRGFREVALEEGVAVAATGRARAGMGVDAADVANDGNVAVTVGNFSGEGLALFTRSASGFSDRASATGLLAPSINRLTFGLAFLDADRDGWQDLVTSNGHVDPFVAEFGGGVTHRQPPQLFRNERGHFTDVSATAGPAFATAWLGRGCAAGDFDNDGRPDLLFCENGGPAHLLRNVTADAHHWLGVGLRGTRSNRDGLGAEIRLTAGGITQRRWLRSGGSFLSQGDPRALFGLGASSTVERLEVRWPSGAVSVRTALAVDQYLQLDEDPAAAPRP